MRLSTIHETVDRRLSYRTGPVCLIERVSERPLCSGSYRRTGNFEEDVPASTREPSVGSVACFPGPSLVSRSGPLFYT